MHARFARNFGLASVLAMTGAATLMACSSGAGTSGTSGSTGSSQAPAAGALASEDVAPTGLARPTWATEDRFTGMVSDNDSINVQVHLKLHNYQDAVDALYTVSDPDSATYGQYLSDDEFNAKYAPTASDVALVRAHLEAHGLTIDSIPSNNLYIQAHGTSAQITKAFSSRQGHYNVSGTARRAPVDQPVLPGDIANLVTGVVGLSDSIKFTQHSVHVGGVRKTNGALAPKGSSSAPSDATTCSQYYGQVQDTVDPAFPGYASMPYSTCGYLPGQVRTAYDLDDVLAKKIDGTGVKVAIIDAFQSPTLLADAQQYFAKNDPTHPLATSQFTAVSGPVVTQPPAPTDPDWYGEQTLDVEAIHTAAPGASIVYVGASSPYDQDLTAAINMVVTNHLATMISNSYGSAEMQANDFVVWQQLMLHAGLHGVGVYFSSGDNGDENAQLGFPSADFPASLTHVTAVGGTSLAIGQNGRKMFETGWATGASWLTPELADGGAIPTDDAGNPEDGGPTMNVWSPAAPGQFVFGGGGGVSNVYAQPRYQKGVVPDAIATQPGTAARAVPDVGMLGDPMTGFLVGQTDPTTGMYGENPIGGTSLACPLFVGTMALAQQKAGHALGFANTALYKLKKGSFHDVTPPATPQVVALPYHVVTTLGADLETINTAVGYDTITGLGSPLGLTFVTAMGK